MNSTKSTSHSLSPSTATVAKFVAQCLIDCGVRHVFGGHGGAVVPLINAIIKSGENGSAGLTWVYTRCEVNASMCAAAYGKLARLGVCIGTSGPGASHLVSGAIDAQLDRVPMIVLTGLKDLGKLGHSDFQDIDQTSLFRAAGLPYSVTIASPHQVLPLMRDAISMALSQSCCVHVALPFDLQCAEITVPEVLCARRADTRFASHPSQEDLEATARILFNELCSKSRIVICVGYRGVKYSGALLDLAAALNAPVLTSLDAKGAIPENHPLSHGVLGVFGNAGTRSGARLMAQADFVVSFCVVDHHQTLTNAEGLQARRLAIFHENTLLADWRFTPTTAVIGSLDTSTRAVARLVREMWAAGTLPSAPGTSLPLPPLTPRELATDTPFAYIVPQEERKDGFCHPGALLNVIGAALPADSIVCVDVGDITLWTAMCMCLDKPGQRVLSSEHMGIMGYSLCAAVAASQLHPDAQKVVVVGDGGFQMSLQELATLQDHGANNLLIVVMVNGRLGRVQNEAWGSESARGCGIGSPDFVKLAEAYGAVGVFVDSDTPSALAEVVSNNLGQRGVRLLAVNQDPDLRPVMHRRPDLGARDHVSLFDRGMIFADSLCPELASAVVFEAVDKGTSSRDPQLQRLSTPAAPSVDMTARGDGVLCYHGSVNHVISGTIPPPLIESPCDCSSTRHAIGEGSPLGVSSMGEGLAVNGTGYCRSVDSASDKFWQTLSGPNLVTGCLVGIGPIDAVPDFRLKSKFNTFVTMATLCTHIVDLTQCDALYVAGVVTFEKGSLAGSALCRPPIYGENILQNKEKYFGPLELDNAEAAYVTGVVASNVDAHALHSTLRRILYKGSSGTLSLAPKSDSSPATSSGSSGSSGSGLGTGLDAESAIGGSGGINDDKLPSISIAQPDEEKSIPAAAASSPEMHLHALVLDKEKATAGGVLIASDQIGPHMAAPEGVIHVDCRATKISSFSLEVFVIRGVRPFDAATSDL